MHRFGLIGSLAASASVAVGIEYLSLTEWGYNQKKSLYEATNFKGFPYKVTDESILYSTTRKVFEEVRPLGLLPDSMFTSENLNKHLLISCARDGHSFATYGFSSWSIGFPFFFLNTSPESVNRLAVRMRHSFTYLWARRNRKDDATHTFERKPLTDTQWDSDAGQDLLNSLVVPNENSLKFLISRLLLETARYEGDTHINSVVWSSFPLAFYGLNKFLKSLFQQRLPMATSIALKLMSGFVLIAGYITIQDFRKCSAERSVDSKAAGISKSYAQGGIDYYNQLLAQNRALRQLQLDINDWKAAQTISAVGDPMTFIRQKSLPLSTRRDVCVAVCDGLKQ